MVTQGLSERHALRIVRMSAAALRYVPRPDPEPGLRDRILALAHRHRRYGAGMIYLKLRQEGRRVNHKRVGRLSTPRPDCKSDDGAARRCPWPIGSRWSDRRRQTRCGRRTLSSIAPPKAAC